MSVNHGEAFVALVLILASVGCVHVRHYFSPDFNRKQYEQCVAKHGGENWTWNGMPMTCRQLTYPSTICDVNGCVGNSETVVPK